MDVVKLYKREAGATSYWEAWESEGKLIVHHGKVGVAGEVEEIKATKSAREKVRDFEQAKRREGYAPIPEEKMAVLRIAYKFDGTGVLADPGERLELEEALDHSLGWTGLGHCDGLELGEGILVAACLVVDYEIARGVIEEDLKETPFAGYAEISRGELGTDITPGND